MPYTLPPRRRRRRGAHPLHEIQQRRRACPPQTARPFVVHQRTGHLRPRRYFYGPRAAGGGVHYQRLRTGIHMGGGRADTPQCRQPLAAREARHVAYVQRATTAAVEDARYGAARAGFASAIVAVSPLRKVRSQPRGQLQQIQHHGARRSVSAAVGRRTARHHHRCNGHRLRVWRCHGGYRILPDLLVAPTLFSAAANDAEYCGWMGRVLCRLAGRSR
mmetsp:Transcript_11566/g.28087  ORF Transcript_11566/g.28087 Transcript_11566/m.28087 type:complete len:218 (-) Transcript_11566:1034-1687(-)